MSNKKAQRWEIRGMPHRAVVAAHDRTQRSFEEWKTASKTNDWPRIKTAHRAYRNCARTLHYLTEMVEFEVVQRNGQRVVVLPNESPYREARESNGELANARVTRVDVIDMFRAVDSLATRGECQHTFSDIV